ncbi:MAG: WbqC family protein [Verrucomicrobiota bacterium]|nr:WbqC family protein [Verrucomicrobiota bacterium]
MKCVAGHQPNLYPYGGFFAKVSSVDQFVIVENTQYVKKQYHNRNRIKLFNGDVKWLSTPVLTKGCFKQNINEAEIDKRKNWTHRHRQTLLYNYKTAPFFDSIFPELDQLLAKEWKYISEFSIACIKLFLKMLAIETPVVIASEMEISGKSTGLILDICKKTNADAYLHGKHSRDYVDFDFLKKHGITNYIQDFHAIKYPQTSGEFSENLSILDILFNCGKERASKILKKGNKITMLATYRA